MKSKKIILSGGTAGIKIILFNCFKWPFIFIALLDIINIYIVRIFIDMEIYDKIDIVFNH